MPAASAAFLRLPNARRALCLCCGDAHDIDPTNLPADARCRPAELIDLGRPAYTATCPACVAFLAANA